MKKKVITLVAACEVGYGGSCWLNEYNLLDCCTHGGIRMCSL